jgi:hypothetical protein
MNCIQKGLTVSYFFCLGNGVYYESVEIICQIHKFGDKSDKLFSQEIDIKLIIYRLSFKKRIYEL